MNSWKGLLACAVVAGAIVFILLRSEGPPTGSLAPDFRGAFAVNGKPAKLSDFKGKVVLIDFWAMWCRPCVEALPHLMEMHKKYKADGLEVVGVLGYESEDKAGDEAKLKHFCENLKLDYLVMILSNDEEARTFKAYGVKAYPQVVLIDRKGVVRHVFVGGGEENANEIDREVKALLAEKN